ncbi:MAG: competence/damage-inducible protein A [Actinomycetes bacterium]
MRVEIVAIGTELLLGQIADTNSAWLGENLAAAGIDSHFHQAVGDNHSRIVLALRTALARSDAVIVCGGLGPTQDDITRAAIAEVMNVDLVLDEEIVATIAEMFTSRGRAMSPNNKLQAEVPVGASIIPQTRGTAPGLICPLGNKVIYAVPGVPYEMSDMFERGILPDLRRRMAESGEDVAVIRSRVLRTWGTSESGLAEAVGQRFEHHEAGGTGLTVAFLASGIEGIKVRLTAKAADESSALALLDAEEGEVVAVIEAAFGPIIFGRDDETMEHAVAALLLDQGLTLGVAESITGGLIASRLVNVVGASAWFRGGIVSYATEVKHSLLGVPAGPVVSPAAAIAMAEGAREQLGSSVAVSVTGVAGPDPQDGQQAGTVFVGVAIEGRPTTTVELALPGDRPRIRQYSAISALDALRRVLLADR